jgi:hypothetical protein
MRDFGLFVVSRYQAQYDVNDKNLKVQISRQNQIAGFLLNDV